MERRGKQRTRRKRQRRRRRLTARRQPKGPAKHAHRYQNTAHWSRRAHRRRQLRRQHGSKASCAHVGPHVNEPTELQAHDAMEHCCCEQML
eukprot:5545714-Prymnesium_polylepis.1